MNQILVTKKLYVTPELKRKKKIYKINFTVSIFIVLILLSICIYAEYDKNKSEEVSQQILASMNTSIEENKSEEELNDILTVVLNGVQEDLNQTEETEVQDLTPQNKGTIEKTKYTTNGYTYYPVGTINIPKIGVNYSIIHGETGSEKETEALLKISPCRFYGPEPNEVGNFCIVGHNYRNTKFFSKVPQLEKGDTVNITDLTGRTLTYSVYNKYTVSPTEVNCIDQRTNGKKEITLITCTNDRKSRVIVKAREIK